MNLLKPNLQKYANDFELIKTLTVNSLKIKYKRSKLGFSWSMLNPIFNLTVIAFVFSSIMGMTYGKFAIFYFSGFLAWNLYSSSVLSSANCLVNNESLIKKVPINLLIFPLVMVGVNVVEFLLALTTLTILLILLGMDFSAAILFLPISFGLLLFFTVGFSLIASVLTAFFRDFAHIFVVMMQLWFFLTPVLYPKHLLSGKRVILLYLNPMTVYIDLFRDPIAYNHLPSMQEVAIASALSLGVFSFGMMIFNKYKSQIVFNL